RRKVCLAPPVCHAGHSEPDRPPCVHPRRWPLVIDRGAGDVYEPRTPYHSAPLCKALPGRADGPAPTVLEPRAAQRRARHALAGMPGVFSAIWKTDAQGVVRHGHRPARPRMMPPTGNSAVGSPATMPSVDKGGRPVALRPRLSPSVPVT